MILFNRHLVHVCTYFTIIIKKTYCSSPYTVHYDIIKKTTITYLFLLTMILLKTAGKCLYTVILPAHGLLCS